MVTIYGTEHCAFCTAARMLLKKKGVDYVDILVSRDAELREEMARLSGRRSVPQIFINDRPIGGFDELHALEQSGELDGLLAGQVNANTD
ncbi:MAG: glutaredoxin 3 [Proteobacteria bacterium]|nr:glutaredoxin 3 [Pseudomonadota bacterium]MDA0992344.1 glutaredoxin 3 [Pseudomonadota bacterium]